ncbi:hypothetical protein EIP86_005346 [Pleurotus ostreatoroseus]|nr:hypothetical protein EIP86_005346 [Pleurotus ostreatoroseus]
MAYKTLRCLLVPFDTVPTTIGDHSSNSLALSPFETSAEPAALHEPHNEEKRDLESGLDFGRTSRPSPITTVLSTGATVGAPHPPPVLDLPSEAPQRPSPETRVRSAPVLRMTGLRQEIDGGVRLVLGLSSHEEPEGISGEPDEEEVLPPPYEARFSV